MKYTNISNNTTLPKRFNDLKFYFFLTLAFGATFLFSSIAQAANLPQGFTDETVLTNLNEPAYINFSPDGRMFINERVTGDLLVANLDQTTGDWTINTEPFYTFDIPNDGNGNPIGHRSSGLRDIVFDPNFETNGYMYAYYMKNSPRHNRVVRIQVDPTNPDVANPASETLLLNLPFNDNSSSGSHNGGSLAFGNDGMLYITTGDGWSGGDPVQSLSTFTGKVLRINTDGTIPTSNPFFGLTSGDYQAIYALGLRNPYTMSTHPETGDIYINEARGNNKADIYKLAPAENYGHQGSGIGTLTGAWANSSQAGGELITGGLWYPASGGTFPSQYNGVYITPLWGSNTQSVGQISYVTSPTNTSVTTFATQIGTIDTNGLSLKPVDMQLGPDGNIYYILTTYQTPEASIERIKPSSILNTATPSITPAGGTFSSPTTVTLSSVTPNTQIYYTTDGTQPDNSSNLYTAPFEVSDDLTVRARAYTSDLNPSGIAIASYVIGAPSVNTPPFIWLSGDQIVELGAQVVLDASGSFDPDGDDLLLTGELWAQLSGPTADIQESNDEISYFFATEPGVYEFNFTVSDGIDSSTVNHFVTVVETLPPQKNAVELFVTFGDNEPQNTIHDGSGNRNHLNLNNGATLKSSPRGTALSLNGTSQYANRSDATLSGDIPAKIGSTGAGDFSLSSWIYFDTNNNRQPIISKQGNTKRGFVFMIEDDNRLTLEGFRNSSSKSVVKSDPLATGQWYHVAVTYDFEGIDNSTAHLYVDGQLVATNNQFVGPIVENDTALEIGRYYWSGSANYYFDGMIDDTMVYREALSATEIAALASNTPIADTLPPVLSNITANNISSTTATIMWDSSEPADTQIEYGLTAGYGSSTLLSTNLNTNHSQTLTGLAIETSYHYRVLSRDEEGNLAQSIDHTFVTTGAPDTTIPTVTITNPTTGTTVLGSFTVTANATDETNIDRVEFFVNNNLSATVVNNPYTFNLNTALYPNGTELILRADAYDVAENIGTHSVTITVENPPATGPSPVASYKFETGSGLTAFDDSGNAQDGEINGATWTNTGASGNALSFDGTNDYVDLDTLDIAGEAFTISLWMNSNDLTSNCGSVRDCRLISKANGTSDQAHYWMLSTFKNGADTTIRFRLKTNENTSTLVAPNGNIEVGQWHHIASVYDGSTMKVYQDGVQIGQSNKTGAVSINDSVPTWIGRNPSGTDAFDGQIDEVNIYTTALTQAEVQSLANVTPPLLDTIAPTITITEPAGSSTISGNIFISSNATDNVGVTSVVFAIDDSIIATDTTAPFSANWDSATLADGVHDISATAYDVANNTALDTVSVNTLNFVPDTTAPSIINVSISNLSETSANIIWQTNEPSTSQVEYGLDNTLGTSTPIDTTPVTDHQVTLDGLVPETEYTFYVLSYDESNNLATSSLASFTTEPSPAIPNGPTPIAEYSFDEGSGTLANDSANGHNGTLENGAAWTTGVIGNNAIAFDGINDYVNLNTLDIAGDALTISFWFNANNFDCFSSSKDCRFISKANGVSEQDHYWMVSPINSSGTKLRFRLKAGGTTKTLVANTGNLTSNTWTHVAAVYDGNTMYLYKDGVQVGNANKSGALDTNNTVAAWIGGNPNSATARPFSGTIDEVKIYQTALSSSEIQNLMSIH